MGGRTATRGQRSQLATVRELATLRQQAREAQQRLAAAEASRPGTARRPEWACRVCLATNWEDRASCRHCRAAKPTQRAGLPGLAAAGSQAGAAKPDAKGGRRTDQQASKEGNDWRNLRPLAPEERAAVATAQAAALQASADALCAAGLAERAEQLQKDAAELRKQAAAAQPPPGRRLDLLKAFVARCEGRADKADKQVEAAQTALREAEAAREEVQQELQDARRKLETLHQDLAAGVVVASPEAMDSDDDGSTEADSFLVSVRALADAVERLPVLGHVGTGPALPAAALQALTAVRQRLGPPATADPPTLDEPLPGGGTAAEAVAAAAAAAAGTSPDAGPAGEAEDDLQRLARDDLDDAAFGAAVRRRLRRGPYTAGR